VDEAGELLRRLAVDHSTTSAVCQEVIECETTHEGYLLGFGCLNVISATTLLSELTLTELATLSVDSIVTHCSTVPRHSIELLHSALHKATEQLPSPSPSPPPPSKQQKPVWQGSSSPRRDRRQKNPHVVPDKPACVYEEAPRPSRRESRTTRPTQRHSDGARSTHSSPVEDLPRLASPYDELRPLYADGPAADEPQRHPRTYEEEPRSTNRSGRVADETNPNRHSWQAYREAQPPHDSGPAADEPQRNFRPYEEPRSTNRSGRTMDEPQRRFRQPHDGGQAADAANRHSATYEDLRPPYSIGRAADEPHRHSQTSYEDLQPTYGGGRAADEPPLRSRRSRKEPREIRDGGRAADEPYRFRRPYDEPRPVHDAGRAADESHRRAHPYVEPPPIYGGDRAVYNPQDHSQPYQHVRYPDRARAYDDPRSAAVQRQPSHDTAYRQAPTNEPYGSVHDRVFPQAEGSPLSGEPTVGPGFRKHHAVPTPSPRASKRPRSDYPLTYTAGRGGQSKLLFKGAAPTTPASDWFARK
jgi:hypothetical protein